MKSSTLPSRNRLYQLHPSGILSILSLFPGLVFHVYKIDNAISKLQSHTGTSKYAEQENMFFSHVPFSEKSFLEVALMPAEYFNY